MGIYMLLPVIAGMGAVAGLAVAAVLVVRCFLKRGPKLFCYLLWSVVLFRLLCPVSIPSMFSALRLVDLKGTAHMKPASAALLESLQTGVSEGKRWEGIRQNGNAPLSKDAGEGTLAADTDLSGYEDGRMFGGAYDLWLAWEGRFSVVRRPAAGETAATADTSQILLPAPPALLLEKGVSGKDVLSEGMVAAWERQGLLENAISVAGGAAGQNVPVGGDAPVRTGYDSLPAWLVIATWIWLCGIAVMLLYSIFRILCLRRKLVGAVRLRGNIYQSDYIQSPFVSGVFVPKIYLPSALCGKEQEYILLHEQTHVRRGDYVFRLLAFAALMLHWFNPLVWLAFYLSGKDMEMACDEAVMKKMKEDIRAEYSVSLLELATGRHFVLGTYLAFGEGDVKGRIKNVMRYKKPTVFWMVFAAIFVSGTVCVFGSDPKTPEKEGHTGILNRVLVAGTDFYDAEDREGQEKFGDGADKEAGSRTDSSGNDRFGETEAPGDVLTVYSLTDSAVARELVAGFASRYPDIEVCHETGKEGSSVPEQIDALTVRLLAGTGPDVLLLDGLPAQSYQENGLLTDMSKTLEPLKEELQENILSAYTEDGGTFMLPARYFVPVILIQEQGARQLESLRSLVEYSSPLEEGRKIDLDGYSWADLLELAYYNYAPEFILPDGSMDEEEIANFVLYTKWLGDGASVEGGEAAHRYFAEELDVTELAEKDAGILLMPFRGMDDLYTYSAEVKNMVSQGRRMLQVGGKFFPVGLVGINAWSTNKELAGLFVQTVFSGEMQAEYKGSGFSVHSEVFEENLADWAKALRTDTQGEVWCGEEGGSKTVDVLAEQMGRALRSVRKGQNVDAAVLQILTEEAIGYFNGEVLLKDCVAAIVERLW